MTTALMLFREITSVRTDGIVIHGVVVTHGRHPKTKHLVLPVMRPWRESAQPFRHDTEGVHWIRGYHAPASAEVLALRSTRALSR